MSWVGWLFLLAGLYVLVVAVRGLVQIASWLIEEYVIEPRSSRQPGEPPKRPETRKAESTLSQKQTSEVLETSEVSGTEENTPSGSRETSPVSAMISLQEQAFATDAAKAPRPLRPNRARRPSWLGGWLKSLRIVAVGKGYDYWVACALAEEDRQAKVRYLSKALQRNPTYHPAWGMKGNALFELGRYDEAAECFDKSLELHPSALVWYRKGLCCYHRGQRQESLRCFDKALEECRGHDRPLLEDVMRMRRLAEEELPCARAP